MELYVEDCGRLVWINDEGLTQKERVARDRTSIALIDPPRAACRRWSPALPLAALIRIGEPI